jgi:hypothetical protein
MQGNLRKTGQVMQTGALLIGACLVAFLAFCPAPAFAQEQAVQGRVLFARAADVDNTAAAEDLAKKCKEAGFNVIVLQVKGPDGAIYFNSDRFVLARAPGVVSFDPLKAVLTVARKEGLVVHAGFCAFLEGPKSSPANDHPQWAALTPRGKTTADLEKSPGIWMCPARRPGYADGYLIPVIEELLKNYVVDGIHLDHLSFPGELSPDSYCFCDYCVTEFPQQSRLYYPVLPDERFEQPESLSDPAANWFKGWTPLPKTYGTLTRRGMGEYMLKGAYAKRGPSDMDYFFYTYRTDAIRDFCAEVYEHARAISPKVQLSARVYWNAPAAGRFAGQRWTDFGQWFDFLVLDLGRSYLPGDFSGYRKLLADVAFYMTRSSRNLVYTYAGLDLEDIYREEREAVVSMYAILVDLAANSGRDPRLPASKLASEFEKIKQGLGEADRTLAEDLEESIRTLVETVKKSQTPEDVYTRIGAKVKRLIERPPTGMYRPGKLVEILGDLQGAGAGSVAIGPFRTLGKMKQWEKLPAILGPAGREPYLVRPLRAPSVQIVRLFVQKQEQLASASAEIELLNRRLMGVIAEIEPLQAAVDNIEQLQKDKLEKLEDARLELEAISGDYARKLAELEKLETTLRELPGAAAQVPEAKPAELEPLPEDMDYGALRRKLEQTIEELKIAIGQRDRAEELALTLTAEIQQVQSHLTEQEQEYLFYISILIALACIGLAIVLVISIVRQRR